MKKRDGQQHVILVKDVMQMEKRQLDFCLYFCGEANGNRTKAAEMAGYSARSAYNIGSRLMKKRFWLKMRDENAVQNQAFHIETTFKKGGTDNGRGLCYSYY